MTKLIIWDFDGTLVDTLPATFAAINDAIEPYTGRRLDPKEIMVHFGHPENEIVARLIGREHAEKCYLEVVRATAKRLKEITIFPGVLETLLQLSDHGYDLAIFTGRSRRTTDVILEHTKLAKHFAHVITADEVTKHKPSPEGIHKICKLMNVAENQSVMIGDSPMDMAAAVSAGAHPIGCNWDGRAQADALREAGAKSILSHPKEIFNENYL
jgi:pyrophosphatase PpaX